MQFVWQVVWLLQKDLKLEWRSRTLVTTLLFFSFLALSVFGLALQASPQVQRQVVAGIIWVTLAFAGTLGMGRLYAAEQEDGGLEALRMAPLHREAIFVAKHIALLLYLSACAIWTVPLAAFFFQAEMDSLGWKLAGVVFLGLWGFAILGTLMATLLLRSRLRELLLPLLFLPVALPLFISCARATAEIFGVGGLPQTDFWLRALLTFDLVFFVVGLWLFPSQIEQD